MSKKIRKTGSVGATSTILLVLGIVIIIVIIIVFVVIRINATKSTDTSTVTPTNEPPKPVYETTVGDVKFVFRSAQNLGNLLIDPQGYQPNLHSTEKFIKVTVGAQNKGKINVDEQSWSLGNIIDVDGRNFIPIDNKIYSLLPDPNLCGTVLKPEFDLVNCVRYYEVSSASTKLKIQVIATVGDTGRQEESFLDLLVTP